MEWSDAKLEKPGEVPEKNDVNTTENLKEAA